MPKQRAIPLVKVKYQPIYQNVIYIDVIKLNRISSEMHYITTLYTLKRGVA